MQDTLHPKEPHGARATQLAPSAVTASAVGGSANHAANSPRWPSLSDDERLVQRHAASLAPRRAARRRRDSANHTSVRRPSVQILDGRMDGRALPGSTVNLLKLSPDTCACTCACVMCELCVVSRRVRPGRGSRLRLRAGCCEGGACVSESVTLTVSGACACPVCERLDVPILARHPDTRK